MVPLKKLDAQTGLDAYVFEINEDKIYKDKCCGEFYAMFFLVMLKKTCRTSKNFAGPADARCYWSYRASVILS